MVPSKTELRRTLKGILRDLRSNGSQEEKGYLLSKNLLELITRLHQEKPDNGSELKIGGFSPLKDEPNWMSELLSDYGDNLSFPSLESNSIKMEFYSCQVENLVVRKDFGVPILGPPKSANSLTPEVLIIPGLSFSKDGKRLGRGKGYYDQYLETFEGISIGVCFHEQVRSDIPFEKHDQKVDFLVTDETVIETHAYN
jgi:5-formyltetrahydrofolate cyclo-ligase